MKIASFDELIAAVKSWSNRDDLSDDLIASFTYMAGSMASQILRVPAMESIALLEVNEHGHVIIPPDFVQLKAMTHEWDSEHSVPLSIVAWDQYVNYLNSDIQAYAPHFFARQGPYWFIAPKPAAGTKVTCHYYRTMPDIGPTEQFNWLVQMSPLSYLYGSLHFLNLYVMDEARADFWLTKFQGELIRIQQMNDLAEHAGTSLTVRSKEYNGVL